MKHRNSHLLIGYWSRLRRGRDIPDQADIDPRAIKRMLSQVFILDARDPMQPLYRLAGTTLCDRFGVELRGTNFFGHWEAPARATLALLLKQALAARLPVCLSAMGTSTQCELVEMETVLAPLTAGPGAPQRFLGMVQFLGDAVPLGGRPIAYERLIRSKIIREDEPPSHPGDLPPPSDSGLLAQKAPHLRLVVSRGEPVTLHSEMDHALQRLIAGLDKGSLLGGVR